MSSEDRIVRTLVDKATGLPMTGRSVEARPTLGGTAIQMPEVGGKGIYASANEVPQGEYKIFVGGNDSNDTHTIGPSRFSAGGGIVGWLNRAMASKVFLSSYMLETDTAPTHAMFAAACADAVATKRELIMDFPITLTANIALTGGSLYIDLNGKTITYGAYQISVDGHGSVRNGFMVLRSSGKSFTSVLGTVYTAVDISGTAVQQQSQFSNSARDTYIGCTGITAKNPVANFTDPSFVGASFGEASKLRLTDDDMTMSGGGSNRLTLLQNFIDSDMDDAVTNNAYLSNAKKTQIDRWTNLPESTKAIIEDGIISNDYGIEYYHLMGANITPSKYKKAGVMYGCATMRSGGGYSMYVGMRGCMEGTIYWDAYSHAAIRLPTGWYSSDDLNELRSMIASSSYSVSVKLWTVTTAGVATKIIPTVDPYLDEQLVESDIISFNVGGQASPFNSGATMFVEFSIIDDRVPFPVGV